MSWQGSTCMSGAKEGAGPGGLPIANLSQSGYSAYDSKTPSSVATRKAANLASYVSFADGEREKPRPKGGVAMAGACLSNTFHPIRVPVLSWLPRYDWKQSLFWDLNAGIVVGILLIPQGMAYALLANLSPIHGLYCAIIPNLVYACLGTSRESAVGAMALVSIMVGNAVLQLAPHRQSVHSRQDTAMKLALLTGVIQMILGWLRLGSIATYVSHPVMVGFCSAGEILIAISQLKYMLGIKVPQFVYAFQTLEYLFRHIHHTKPYTLLMGLISFTSLYALSWWKRKQKALAESNPSLGRDPRRRALRVLANFGPFVVIVVTALFAWAMDRKWGSKTDVIGKVPQGFQIFQPQRMTVAELQHMLPSSVILAVISYMLSFSVAKKYALANRYEIDASQELFGMGAADAVGSFFGAFPVAGGFARTAVNVEAGAQSQLSSVVSALLVALAVNLLTGAFYYIPMCSLAAIVQVAICNVLDYTPYVKAWRTSKVEFVVMVLTFAVTLILGIDKGIIAGVAISIVVLIRSNTLPRVRVLGRLPDCNVFRDCTRYPNARQFPGIRILRVDESINFASCASVKEQVLRLAHEPDSSGGNSSTPPPNIVLDCSGVNHLDLSGLNVLEEIRDGLSRQRPPQTLLLANAKAKLRDKLKRAGLFAAFGGKLLYLSLPALVATLVEAEEDQLALTADLNANTLDSRYSTTSTVVVVVPEAEEDESEEDEGIEWYI